MGGPAPQMLSYILPNLTAAASSHLPRRRTAQGYKSTRLRRVPKLKVTLSCQGLLPILGGATHSLSKVRFCLTMFYRGFVPHFWGVQICTPLFLNFGPGGIAPGWAQVDPLLLTWYLFFFKYSIMKCYINKILHVSR